MKRNERLIVSVVLFVISLMVTLDLLTDLSEGVAIWHAVIEGSIAIVALFGIFYLMRDSFGLKRKLQNEIADFSAFKKEAEHWRQQTRQYVEGLSLAIDRQLTKWNLTNAEKEVAFLLLKGLTFKEVAEVRKTSEKTARTQSLAVYSKSGLAGRSELSAFFLEDLLVPNSTLNGPSV